MARPYISDTYPPRVDFTMTPVAYGLRAVPRMMRELVVDEMVIRRRTLNSLVVYLVDPLHVQECIEGGVVRILTVRLAEKDYLVRERTTMCLQLLSKYHRGVEGIILGDVVEVLKNRIDDPEVPVRVNAYNVFINLAADIRGAYEIANYDLVSVFVEKLCVEIPETKKLVYQILHNIMEYLDIRQDVLATPAMTYFTTHLQDNDEEIRTLSARCIGDLATEVLGKTQANECGTVELLCGMLLDENTKAPLAPVTYALMMILVDIEARYRFLKEIFRVLPRLMALVHHPAPEIALNAVKTATLLAESPEGRAYLLTNLSTLKELLVKPDPLIRHVAETLLEVTTRLP